jgi:hypothetical protein
MEKKSWELNQQKYSAYITMSKREYDFYHQQRRLDHQEYVASTMAVCSSNQRGSIVEHVGLSIKNEDLINNQT